jgi:hypothetical protein
MLFAFISFLAIVIICSSLYDVEWQWYGIRGCPAVDNTWLWIEPNPNPNPECLDTESVLVSVYQAALDDVNYRNDAYAVVLEQLILNAVACNVLNTETILMIVLKELVLMGKVVK